MKINAEKNDGKSSPIEDDDQQEPPQPESKYDSLLETLGGEQLDSDSDQGSGAEDGVRGDLNFGKLVKFLWKF